MLFRSVVRRTGIPDYPSDPAAQVELIPSIAATTNGIYGLKLHAHEFDQLEGTRWVERMPSLSFVYLERRDVLAQAISFVRARQTGQWVAGMSASAAPHYDAAAIQHALIETLSRQNRWRYYFARNGIAYLHLVYEDVTRAPQEAVDAIALLVGLDTPARIDPGMLRFEVQRDDTNREWRDRFVSEMRDLGRFD